MTLTTYQLPLADMAAATRVGARKWKKQLLPRAVINHQGRTLDFSDPVLQRIKANFDRRPFDYVPVNAATEQNMHNEDPFRYVGEVKDLSLEPDGLYGIIEVNEKGDALLAQNPRIGSSPRYYANFRREWDGADFGPVIRHVCLTQDPHISGLKPGEFVEMSQFLAPDPGEECVDMTASAYEPPSDIGGDPTAVTNPNPPEGGAVNPPAGGGFDMSRLEALDFSNADVVRGAFAELAGELLLTRQELDDERNANTQAIVDMQRQGIERSINAEIQQELALGVPPTMLRAYRRLMLSDLAATEIEYTDLARGDDGNPIPGQLEQYSTSGADLLRQMVAAARGRTRVGPQQTDPTVVSLSAARRGAPVSAGQQPAGRVDAARARQDAEYSFIVGSSGKDPRQQPSLTPNPGAAPAAGQ